MRRRGTVLLGLTALSVAGIALAVALAAAETSMPLHFWVRDGEVSGRLYESPGGREIAGWDAGDSNDADLRFRRHPGLVERALVATGLRAGARDWVAHPVHGQAPEGWREYVAFHGDARTFDAGIVDPRAVGDWTDGSPTTWSLRPSGLVAEFDPLGIRIASPPQRWCRIDDVLVIEGAPRPLCGCTDLRAFVVPPGGTIGRGIGGAALRKVR